MRAAASGVAVRHYRLSRVEYDRAVEAGDQVAPLARPAARIVVDDLLP